MEQCGKKFNRTWTRKARLVSARADQQEERRRALHLELGKSEAERLRHRNRRRLKCRRKIRKWIVPTTSIKNDSASHAELKWFSGKAERPPNTGLVIILFSQCEHVCLGWMECRGTDPAEGTCYKKAQFIVGNPGPGRCGICWMGTLRPFRL